LKSGFGARTNDDDRFISEWHENTSPHDKLLIPVETTMSGWIKDKSVLFY